MADAAILDRRPVVTLAPDAAGFAIRLDGRLVVHHPGDRARAEAAARTFAETYGFTFITEGEPHG
jgi:hypothetical protein